MRDVERQDRELHPTTLRTLRELAAFILNEDHGPSVRELVKLTDLRSVSNVTHHLDVLEDRRLIESPRVGGRQQRAARSVRLTAAGRRLVQSSRKR